MRRRSLKLRYLVLGVTVFCAIVLIFIQVFTPIERFIFDFSSRVILGLDYAGIVSAQLADSDDFRKDNSNNFTRVIGKRSDIFQDIFIINNGAPVGTKVVSEGVLVGFVIEQGDKTSKVRAISSPMYTTGGIISRSGIPIELEGMGANILQTRIPRLSDVARGDMIYHDMGDALVLGQIVDIIDVPSDPFIILRVMHPINFATIFNVELLSPSQ